VHKYIVAGGLDTVVHSQYHRWLHELTHKETQN